MSDIQFVISEQPEELALAAQLIDGRDDNAHPLDHQVFFDSRAVILAKTIEGEIVGCAAIKAGKGTVDKGTVGELGYLVVSPYYRRQGIAQGLTQKRIEVAKALGISILYATIRAENTSSQANLLKAGFQFWRDYLSIRGTGNTVGWYYLALSANVDAEAIMLSLVGDRIQAV
ncbi:GNAT family N-acetyltransferase [Shewanella baltica]|uniref:GNAT family N-acetyltransferase n=1 Tax=Shewanella baltica TaxID=62322 RepID=UPI00217D9473|nr:GNAT family N-acetyltransferase [Shewanella baltica]MCS6125630.1 GNAT family N-acetyltransferase [Shewanella baltica]MCS6138256.1 GNAT family N-acetyltransferase [Shewanella baltica]MCS6144125.1 GNAT family N-acetyltransferase [Shewanella baltica]MCS6168420.1 GNAT family N-acetyltransferase [Shewanella baltica]MCS6185622.1 GNAT family N-acetyltransferase [Shewanella baltica]